MLKPMAIVLRNRFQTTFHRTRVAVQHQDEIGELVELFERANVSRKFISTGIPAYDDVFMTQPQLDVQYIQHAADHTFGDIVFARY